MAAASRRPYLLMGGPSSQSTEGQAVVKGGVRAISLQLPT